MAPSQRLRGRSCPQGFSRRLRLALVPWIQASHHVSQGTTVGVPIRRSIRPRDRRARLVGDLPRLYQIAFPVTVRSAVSGGPVGGRWQTTSTGFPTARRPSGCRARSGSAPRVPAEERVGPWREAADDCSSSFWMLMRSRRTRSGARHLQSRPPLASGIRARGKELKRPQTWHEEVSAAADGDEPRQRAGTDHSGVGRDDHPRRPLHRLSVIADQRVPVV